MRRINGSTPVIQIFLLILLFFTAQPLLAVHGDIEAAQKAWPMIEAGALLVDVRSREEFAEGHIEGALNIGWEDTNALAAAIGEDKTRPVVFYCRSGNRAGKSIAELEKLGYSGIYNATGLEALQATRP